MDPTAVGTSPYQASQITDIRHCSMPSSVSTTLVDTVILDHCCSTRSTSLDTSRERKPLVYRAVSCIVRHATCARPSIDLSLFEERDLRRAPATENLDMAQDEHRDPSREQNGEGGHLQDQRQVASEMAKVRLYRVYGFATT